MGRLSAQMQLYIGIGVVVVLALLVVVLVILPVYQESSALNAQIATENGNLATAQALLARRQSAKARSAANEVELMQIANALPDTPQLPSVIIEIQDLANASGVLLDSITPQDMKAAGSAAPGASGAGYSAVPISLRMTASHWADAVDMYHRVAKFDRGVRVVGSTFQYMEGSEEKPGYIDMSVSLEVYVMGAAATNRVPGSGSAAATATVPAQ